MKITLLTLLGLTLAMTNFAAESNLTLPVPAKLRIESASLRGGVWAKLPEDQKKLTYWLVKAGREGRDLLFYQNHRHALG